MIGKILIVLVTLAGVFLTFRYCRQNLIRIREKNRAIREPWKRALNYPFTVLWYGYLFVFFFGLTINNLILG
ncbi:MAG: hypothetical protein LBR60_00685 [Fibrobacter sp.]|nr:hypothetical protein [Fibrobacter sp.]